MKITEILTGEAIGGATLSAAVIAAVAWATLAPASYLRLTTISVSIPGVPASQVHDLATFVVNTLMVIFFAGIGLEIARERSVGALRDRATAVLPILAAVGGMVGAAATYLVVIGLLGPNDAVGGWGIPMATDIAFTLAALSLIQGRVSLSLRIFLLALAVADDVLSVIVLAVTGHHPGGSSSFVTTLIVVGIAGSILLCIWMRRRRQGWVPWVILGATLWWLFAKIGIEPTLAGVVVGILVPHGSEDGLPGVVLERAMVPLSTWFVLPLFALVAAGVDLRSISLEGRAGLVLAILAARSIGKLIGIGGATAIAIRFGLGSLPTETSRLEMAGAAITCGIGFTVPLLFAEQAFGADASLLALTKVSLLAASLVCAVIGISIMASGSLRPSEDR